MTKRINRNCQFIFLIITTFILTGCDSKLKHALDTAGKNRSELEKVLDYFKNDSDALKYKAARFLIENMPYHYSYYGKYMEKYDSAYSEMAKEPILYRDSVFKSIIDIPNLSDNKLVKDIDLMSAKQLIKIINRSCDIWHNTSWYSCFPEKIFFEYVLPYRIYNEQYSDWDSTIDREFNYLTSSDIISNRGIIIEAEDCNAHTAEIWSTESASNGKGRLLNAENSCVIFTINTPIKCRKQLSIRYSSPNKNSKICILLNGKAIDSLDLEPTNTIKFFRNSTKSINVSLSKGCNTITIKRQQGNICLDHLLVASIETVPNIEKENFLNSFYYISNKNSGRYIAFDTTAALKELTLKNLPLNDQRFKLRLDYCGNHCWSIKECNPDSLDLCLEVLYATIKEDAQVGQYNFINGNHQKWVIIPDGDGFYKIMGKDSGLYLDIYQDSKNEDHIKIAQYANIDSQKWKLEKVSNRENKNPLFIPGNSFDKATKIFDVMDKYEWISFKGAFMPKISSLIKGKTGNCREEAAFTIFLCRYLGIPATVDFTPHWANRSQAHLWSVLIKPNGKSIPFYMGHTPGDTINFFHPYLKPKIFRHQFSINHEIFSDLRDETDIPFLFKIPNFIDVTDEYYTTVDIVRKIPKNINEKIVYICVFDNRNWVPVHYGKITKGEVVFKSMVKNIAYITAVYKNGHIIPFGNPFIVNEDGSVLELKAKINRTQNMILTRKYPFMGKEDIFNYRMSGGRFQAANNSDFSNSVDLHVHRGITNGNWYDIPIIDSNKYHRIRYLGPDGSYCNINEMEFYSSKGSLLKGKIIGTEGISQKTKESVFDGDVLTGFEGVSPDGHWVGMEFNQPETITRIRYIPRNDGNCIEIGDRYELMFWHENDWKSLGTQKATSNILEYNNVPTGGLYIVKNLTKGHEERIFTYENGSQIWW